MPCPELHGFSLVVFPTADGGRDSQHTGSQWGCTFWYKTPSEVFQVSIQAFHSHPFSVPWVIDRLWIFVGNFWEIRSFHHLHPTDRSSFSQWSSWRPGIWRDASPTLQRAPRWMNMVRGDSPWIIFGTMAFFPKRCHASNIDMFPRL